MARQRTGPATGTDTERYPPDMPLEERIPDGAVLVPKHAHEWVESLRYLPFSHADLEGYDTDEPPRNADGETMTLYDDSAPAGRGTAVGGGFDEDKHYRLTAPGPEIVSFCSVCSDTRVQPVKASAYKKFLTRLNAGELEPEQVSLLSLDELLGEGWEDE